MDKVIIQQTQTISLCTEVRCTYEQREEIGKLLRRSRYVQGNDFTLILQVRSEYNGYMVKVIAKDPIKHEKILCRIRQYLLQGCESFITNEPVKKYQ